MSLFNRVLKKSASIIKARFAGKHMRRIEGSPTVCILSRSFPSMPDEQFSYLYGGEVKLTYLKRKFTHRFPDCNILYRVSSVFTPAEDYLLDMAQKRHIKIITNQNGIYLPFWSAGNWKAKNQVLAARLRRSSFIVFQSEFCKEAVYQFMPNLEHIPSQIIFNPTDLKKFSAHCSQPSRSLGREIRILSMWGIGHRFERVRTAIRGIAEARRSGSPVSLRLLGVQQNNTEHKRLQQEAIELWKKLGCDSSSLRFTPPYLRDRMAEVFSEGDIFLHLAFNDPSPNVIGEALGAGLPIIFSNSGGCPELVGDAGIGLAVNRSWENVSYPDIERIVEAVKSISKNYENFSIRARQRAERLFDLPTFYSKHERIFDEMCHK